MDTVDKHVSDCATDNTHSTLADGPALTDATTFCSACWRDMSEPEKYTHTDTKRAKTHTRRVAGTTVLFFGHYLRG